MFPQGSVELLYTCVSAVHSPRSTFVHCPTVFCGALAPLHAVGVCASLHFALFVHAPAPACSVRGLLLSTCTWLPRVCCSAILHSNIVSGLFPHPSVFSTVYTISV